MLCLLNVCLQSLSRYEGSADEIRWPFHNYRDIQMQCQGWYMLPTSTRSHFGQLGNQSVRELQLRGYNWRFCRFVHVYLQLSWKAKSTAKLLILTKFDIRLISSFSWLFLAIIILFYCSFKIFLRFWLAKIHYNQLLSAKFGRILRYRTDDVNRKVELPDYWTVNWEMLETRLGCFGVQWMQKRRNFPYEQMGQIWLKT